MKDVAVYSDFASLASLRHAARSNAAANLNEAASQFESLFLQMMLQSMRDATQKGGLFDSHQLDSYQSMYDQQLALELAAQGGVGIADAIVEQLQTWVGNPATEEIADESSDRPSRAAEPGELCLAGYRAHALKTGSTGDSDDSALVVDGMAVDRSGDD
ncbi:MAG: rod-binding protein [Pseudomonadota bacterium]